MHRSSLSLPLLVLLASACATEQTKRYTQDEARALLKQLEVVSLELGEFPIDGASSVLDGDTIRVKGLPASLRLLGIDTEETFKKDRERAAFAAGWEQYKKKMRGSSSRPVKFATPLGEDAKHFAQAFFEDVRSVRIERDHPGEIRDFYNRYLAYVFAKKNGVWVNYNVE
jgi:endonuclease YncB( thermonuclease family)